MFIKNEHTRKLKEELPYIAQYFETIPIEMGINENDELSESSAGSYEAREEWTEQDYRKLMINFNRNEAQYEVDRMVTELAIQRDPENLVAIEEEYTKGRELLNYRQKRGHDLLKVAKAYADYTRRQERLREEIRQEEMEKLQNQVEKVSGTQWRSREEQLQKEMIQKLQQKEDEWAEKVKKQAEMSKKLEEQCENLKALESKCLTELRNQLQQKQLETEQFWSELTNTWGAEKITKDSKIDELRTALEEAKEQKLAAEQAWKTTLEAERLEKLEQVNKLLERVKMMENKQNEIKQDMEKKLKNVQETAQERFQRSITQMKEDYQSKLEKEIQKRSLEYSQKERTRSTVNEAEGRLNSKQTAIETVKRMLHQDQEKTESPEMDWDYYGGQSQDIGQQYEKGALGSEREKKVERKQIPNRAASTPLEEEPYSRNYSTFGLSAVERHYSCENCLKRHEPPLCMCPSCQGPHLISKCPYGGIPEGETIPKIRLTEPWKKCETCHLCHQGTCPCARCGGLAHIAVDCVVSTMENWSKIPSAKRSR